MPPQTTRAKLRGDFIRAAQEGRNDYTVDWVHLKLNDQAQRTVLCKDPFLATDERVDRLIASMRGAPTAPHRRPTPVVPDVLGSHVLAVRVRFSGAVT